MRMFLLPLISFSLLGGMLPAAEKVDYTTQIKPIFKARCFSCHGALKQEADLRLDRSDDAEEVLSRDDPGESELMRRITSADSDERMPPPESKITLSVRDIETLGRWIRQGAPYEGHWSFSPIQRVAVPRVNQTAWPLNEIDHFVLARLEQEKLAPSSVASKEQLIRRLSFDLTGLPPSIHGAT